MNNIRWLALFCLLLFTSGCTKKEVSITTEQAKDICIKELISRNIDTSKLHYYIPKDFPRIDSVYEAGLDTFRKYNPPENVDRLVDFIKRLKNKNYWTVSCYKGSITPWDHASMYTLYIEKKSGEVLYFEIEPH